MKVMYNLKKLILWPFMYVILSSCIASFCHKKPLVHTILRVAKMVRVWLGKASCFPVHK